MAGRPRLRDDLNTLRYMSPANAEPILAMLRDGVPLIDVARRSSFSKMALTEWIESDATRDQLYKRACALRAEVMIEDSIRIADQGYGLDGTRRTETGIVETSDAARDKIRVQARQWAVPRIAPEKYGERAAPAIQINLQTLHIDALRQVRPQQVVVEHRELVPKSHKPVQVTDNT